MHDVIAGLRILRCRVVVLEDQVVRLPLETARDFALRELAPLGRYLEQQGRSRPVQLLAVGLEERFQIEKTLPATRRQQRVLAVARARRLFPELHYTRVVPYPGGQNMLYAAIQDGGGLQELVELLRRHRIPLAGIHTLPWLLARLVRGVCNADCLVLGVHATAVDQVLLIDGQPHFSRRMTIPAGSTAQWSACLEVVPSLRTRFRSLPMPLSVVLCAPAGICRAWQEQLPAAQDVRLRATVPCSMRVLAQASTRLSSGYAGVADTAACRQWRWRQRSSAAGWILCMAGLAGSGYLYVGSLGLREQVAGVQAQLGQLRSTVPTAGQAAPAALQAMQFAVATAAAVRAGAAVPQELLHILGAALLQEPLLQLETLQWQEQSLQCRLSITAGHPAQALRAVDRLAAVMRTAAVVVKIMDAPLSADTGHGRMYFTLHISSTAEATVAQRS